MAKAGNLTVFDCGRIVELHQHNLPSLLRLDAVRKSFRIFFLKDPEGYGTKKVSCWTQKNFSGAEPEVVNGCPSRTRHDPPPTLPVTFTGADCSPVTIRRHLRGKDFNNKTCLQRSPSSQQHCPFGLCKGGPNMGRSQSGGNQLNVVLCRPPMAPSSTLVQSKRKPTDPTGESRCDTDRGARNLEQTLGLEGSHLL